MSNTLAIRMCLLAAAIASDTGRISKNSRCFQKRRKTIGVFERGENLLQNGIYYTFYLS